MQSLHMKQQPHQVADFKFPVKDSDGAALDTASAIVGKVACDIIDEALAVQLLVAHYYPQAGISTLDATMKALRELPRFKGKLKAGVEELNMLRPY